jgi:hypothetical protein
VGLKDRVSKLERRTPPPAPCIGSFAEEIRAIDAEIRQLEEEMRTEGMDPDECLRDVDVSIPLDEHIAMLEEEIAREEAKR